MMWPLSSISRRPRSRRSPRRRRALRPALVERMEDRTLLSLFAVTTTDDNGDNTNPTPGSLRAAILAADADTGAATDTIDFDIPGPGVHTIQPLSALPHITHSVTIDGYSQPGSSPNTLAVGDNAVLNIEIDGSLAGSNSVYGLVFTASGNTVQGLVVHSFSYPSISLFPGIESNRIQGNFLGTDPTGEHGLGSQLGVEINGGSNDLIGTNGDGVNDYGERNIVMSGIAMSSSDTIVAGNYIGTDACGTVALGNTGYGIYVVSSADGNRIGVDGHDPDAAAERNVISGNQSGGIRFYDYGGNSLFPTGNVVAGNYIGTDVTGTKALPNGTSSNPADGVLLWGNDNRVGTDGDGVGDDLERNVISGNSWTGVEISGNNNIVAGNYVGTDATGTRPLGNATSGVNVTYGSSGNRIGTDGQSVDDAGERNIISSNAGSGIVLTDSQDNLVAGNWIGRGADGAPMPNTVNGVFISNGETNDQIGGSSALANVIAENTGYGVIVGDASTTGISIRANSIYGNGSGAIQLAGSPAPAHGGPIPGPNYFQNAPVLATATAGSTTHVAGTLYSAANGTYTVDFYANDPDEQNGGGRYYLGFATVTTDAGGNASFDVSNLAASTAGQWISATATDASGDTSEFAPNVQAVQAASATTLTASAASPLLGQSITFTAVVGGNSGTPTGSVDFFDTTTNTDLGAVPLANGVAALTTSTLAVGGHTIVASYGGDPTYVTSRASTTIDVLPPASLSGTVFEDFNDDGQVDFGELGIQGVRITLTGTDDRGDPVNLGQLTDGDGTYVFLGLRPGTYTIAATQPAGYTQGINTVGTAGGTVTGDAFTAIGLAAGTDGLNYNYGERPTAGSAVSQGQTATIGFWNNNNGQALIRALNGGSTSTQLGNWLSATFPNMFGANAGANDLACKANDFIASFFQARFVVHGQKLDAQVLATALAVYVTNATLDDTGVGTQYGFTVSGDGVGTSTYNVGTNGAAFGVADGTVVTVMDLLLAADAQAVNGVLYNGDTTKRDEANSVFSGINQAGDIA